jgi:hypothetical protein
VPAGSVWAVDRAHGRLCTSVAVTLLPSAAWFDGQGVVSCCGLASGQPVNATGCVALAGRALLGGCAGGEVAYSVSRDEPGVVMLLLASCLAIAAAAAVCAAATSQLLSPLSRRTPGVKAVALFSLPLGVALCWSLFHFASALGPWIALVILACLIAGAWPALVAFRIVNRPVFALCVFGWCAGLHAAWLIGIAEGLAGIALLVKVNLALWAPHSSALYRFFTALAFEHALLLVLLAPRILRSFRKSPPPAAPPVG